MTEQPRSHSMYLVAPAGLLRAYETVAVITDGHVYRANRSPGHAPLS